MSKAEDKLQHWMMLLLNNPEYRAIYERIGTPAQRDERVNTVERMRHFRAAVAAGIFPDVHTLAFLAVAFGKYLETGGAMPLELALGLDSEDPQ